ncbi:MAG: iron uptake transporter deferrochelatase/peroxidase subunit [Ornithinimicrobium sp.]
MTCSHAPAGPGRRTMLAAALGSVGAVAGVAACSTGSSSQTADSVETSTGTSTGSATDHAPRYVDFAGEHQNGVTAMPVPALASVSAFRVTARDRDELTEMFTELSTTIADLMAGRMPQVRDPAYPPAETGILGPEPPPDDLAVVVSVGATLFDERFGLADRKPRQLEKMPFLANDRLDIERSHGDILVSIEAGHEDTIQHALRQVMRATRSHLILTWTTEGYARGSTGAGGQTPRNLLGFMDGTANLNATDDDLMNRHVWVSAEDDEPQWAVGGSYQVVRVIRMLVEFWDRTRLGEQEALIGRNKETGAPLGMESEFDEVSYADDPEGDVIPLDAHIRLANPRTQETADELMLRRGFSYTRGVDKVGHLDQGLAFVSYQRSLSTFLAVQERLKGEPLEEYIRPEGGGFFFALPGVDKGASLAEGLLA